MAAKKERRHNIGLLMNEHNGKASDVNSKTNDNYLDPCMCSCCPCLFVWIAAEKCFKGCKLICKEIKEGDKDTDIIYKYWQKERDSFFVLPWNKKSVTYLNS